MAAISGSGPLRVTTGAAACAPMSPRCSRLGNVREMARDEQLAPWPAGSATGVGSMPGTDPAEAARVVAGELPDFPHLPELPDRGPGADLTGRTAGLLVDMPVETTAGGWRIAERPGRQLRAARALLSSDLDALEEVLAGYVGPLKVAVCGPWTLAATIQLPHASAALLADEGAVTDLVASLAEGAAAHVAEVARRVPGARLVVQVDEPALPAVAGGVVPTASGLSRYPPVEADTLAGRLGSVLRATGCYSVVHCCATPLPFGIVDAAGADGISFDLGLLRRGGLDAVGAAVEAGRGLLVGVVDALGDSPIDRAEYGRGGSAAARETVDRVLKLWRTLGISTAGCAAQVVLTPTCGLAAAAPAAARSALAHCRQAARLLPELAAEASR